MICSKCGKRAVFISTKDYLDDISRNSFCQNCYKPPTYNPICAVGTCKNEDVKPKTVFGRNDYLCAKHAHLGHDAQEA